MKKLLIALTLLGVGNSLHAQEKSTKKLSDFMKVFIGAGVNQYSLSEFNTMAASNGFPQFKDGTRGAVNFGFVINEKSRLLNTMNCGLMFGNKVKGNNFVGSHSVASFDLNYGYAIVKNEKHNFGPLLGIGFLSHSVSYNQDFSAQTFAQTMQNISGERNYYSGLNFYLNPSIMYDYTIKNKTSVAIVAGYKVGLNNSKWRIADSQKTQNAPTSNASGFYASLLFMF